MNKKTKKELKALAHHLNPVVMTGANGLTDAVHEAIDEALSAHELIKIKLNANDRDERTAMLESVLARHRAELIQKIGHTATIYREAPNPAIADER